MATLSAVRAGLVTRLETISGLRVEGSWPDTIKTPSAVLDLQQVPNRTSFAGRTSYFFQIHVFVQLGQWRSAAPRLDEYCDLTGAKSIMAAIEADTTLGGAAEDIEIGGWSAQEIAEVDGNKYWSSVLPIEVYVTF